MIEKKHLAPPRDGTLKKTPTIKINTIQCGLCSVHCLWEFHLVMLPIDTMLTKMKRFHLVISMYPLLKISNLFSLMWPRRIWHRESSLDARLLAYDIVETKLVKVEPLMINRFPCLVPYIIANLPFPLICITPPSTSK